MAAERSEQDTAAEAVDLGEYCRRVEQHLTRVNEGHIIRIAGTSFEVVRSWALEGIPLGIVYRGIDQKAERHRAGRSKRPLRLEFCEGDVRSLYDDWRRAVGAWSRDESRDGTSTGLSPALEERRRPSVTRQLDRAIDRLVTASGRIDQPAGLADALAAILDELVELRDELRRARGAARGALVERASVIDRAIGDAARRTAGDRLAHAETDARRELAAFRSRMPPAAWERSVHAATDRLLRDEFGLPSLDLDAIQASSAGDV